MVVQLIEAHDFVIHLPPQLINHIEMTKKHDM